MPDWKTDDPNIPDKNTIYGFTPSDFVVDKNDPRLPMDELLEDMPGPHDLSMEAQRDWWINEAYQSLLRRHELLREYIALSDKYMKVLIELAELKIEGLKNEST